MFLKNYPAMKIDKSLVISDLHIGITKDMYDKGVVLPSQVKEMADTINKLKRKTNTNKLIILGDVKHKVPGISLQEFKEVPLFFSLLKYKDIIIVKGNHDGNIEKLVDNIGGVKVKKSATISDYYLTHGHRNVNTKKNTIVIGHNQPHVKFIDRMRARYVEPVWVKGNLKGGKELIIMPAFNRLCGATIVNKNRLLGPIAKKLIKSRAHVYLLDGTDIGTIKDLWIKE